MQLPIFEVSFIVIYICTRRAISRQSSIICRIIKLPIREWHRVETRIYREWLPRTKKIIVDLAIVQ